MEPGLPHSSAQVDPDNLRPPSGSDVRISSRSHSDIQDKLPPEEILAERRFFHERFKRALGRYAVDLHRTECFPLEHEYFRVIGLLHETGDKINHRKASTAGSARQRSRPDILRDILRIHDLQRLLVLRTKKKFQ